MRKLIGTTIAVAMITAMTMVSMTPAVATQGDPDHKVTICHRTNSVTNPYVKITVDEASVNMNTGDDKGKGDHNAEHNGPTFDVTGNTDYSPPMSEDDWGDIIPPFYAPVVVDKDADPWYDTTATVPGYWDPKNWDEAGQAIFNAGCKLPGEPEETFFAVTKTIPNVLNDNETADIELSLFLVENGEPAGLVDVCTLHFAAGDPKNATGDIEKTCTFEHLTPGVNYVLVETDSDGFGGPNGLPLEPYYFTGGDSSGTTYTLENGYGPATAQACKVTDSADTGYDASGDTFSFDLVFVSDPSLRLIDEFGDPLYQSGDVIETVTVYGGGTTEVPNCETFSTVLEDNVTYDIVEQTATGWNTSGGIDEFTPQYPGDADFPYIATYTNSIEPAYAEVCKVTNVINGMGFNASAATFTFDLVNTTADPDVVVETTTLNGGGTVESPNCDTFDAILQDGITYEIQERDASPWTTTSDSAPFTPTYPAAETATFTVTYTNTRTFSAPLTPGYWKTHLSYITSHNLLSQYLGGYEVNTNAKVTSIFNVMNCNNVTNNTQNAIGCLAGHLLATKLNIANGSDSTCIAQGVLDADYFLGHIPTKTGGTIVYAGPTSTNYSAISVAGRNQAITLKTALDHYNNGSCT